MSNKQGYIKTLNEWHLDNVRLTGTFMGSGNQITINKPGIGKPVLRLGGNPSYNNDLFLIEKPNGEDIFRVDAEGTIWIDGNLHNQTIPMDEKSVLFVKGNKFAADQDQFVWDHETNRLGVGTQFPQAKIHIEGGDLDIHGGTIKLDGVTHLRSDKSLLFATDGDANPDSGLIFGDPTSGSSVWRFVVSNDEVLVQKKIEGVWQTRQKVD